MPHSIELCQKRNDDTLKDRTKSQKRNCDFSCLNAPLRSEN